VSPQQYVRISWYHCFWDHWGIYIDDYYNKLYSSLDDLTAIPWGLTTVYQLCQLDQANFLYTFDLGNTGLRKYVINTLDSSEVITGIGEPGFGAPQQRSSICVHSNGDFRVIFKNSLFENAYVYSRHYYSTGAATGPDTVVSLTESLTPAITNLGAIARTSLDQMLITWPYQGDVYGTLFEGQYWNEDVNEFECTPAANYLFPCMDINTSNHVLVVWMNSWYNGQDPWLYTQLYCGAFDQIYSVLYAPIAVSPPVPDYSNPYAWDVCVRNDGRFIICWSICPYANPYSLIYLQPGENYHEIIGAPILISPFNWDYVCTSPVVEKSADGYWVTWIQGDYFSPWTFELYL